MAQLVSEQAGEGMCFGAVTCAPAVAHGDGQANGGHDNGHQAVQDLRLKFAGNLSGFFDGRFQQVTAGVAFNAVVVRDIFAVLVKAR